MNRYSKVQLYVLEKPTVKCSDVTHLLRQYTDQELPLTLRSRVDSHIHHCGACAAEFESYQLIVDSGKLLKSDAPLPHAVKNRLHAALNARLGLSLPVSE